MSLVFILNPPFVVFLNKTLGQNAVLQSPEPIFRVTTRRVEATVSQGLSQAMLLVAINCSIPQDEADCDAHKRHRDDL
jgi:hypothetical protein